MNIVLDFAAAVVAEEAQPVKHHPTLKIRLLLAHLTLRLSLARLTLKLLHAGLSHTQATGPSHN